MRNLKRAPLRTLQTSTKEETAAVLAVVAAAKEGMAVVTVAAVVAAEVKVVERVEGCK